jgi:PAS domain S-box-containing protein
MMKQNGIFKSLRIALIYLVLGMVYIIFSDKLLGSADNTDMILKVQTFKGLAFILVTSFLIFLLVFRELNRRLASEHKLAESEALYRQYFEAAPYAIIISEFLKVSSANRQAQELFGYSEEELSHLSLSDLTPKEQSDGSLSSEREQGIIREVTAGITPSTEWTCRKKNGQIFEANASFCRVDLKGSTKMMTILVDISERKKYLEELQQKTIFIQTILDNLPIGLALNRFNEGTATYMNKKFLEIYGWPEQELTDIGQFFERVYPDPVYREEISSQILKDIESGDPGRMHWENVLITQKSGETRVINASNIPLIEQNTMVSTVQDVTERNQALKEIRTYRDALKQLTTEITLLEEKQRREIAANIHDHLSQSLVLSNMQISTLQKKTKDEKLLEGLQHIEKHIAEALEFSRKITYDLSPPILYEMGIAATIQLMVQKIQDESDIQIDFRSEVNDIELPEQTLALLYRAVKEIIFNALKHADAGKLKVHFRSADKGLDIQISDNGKGFDINQVEAPRTVQKGYGLFAVRERVQNLGGDLAIVSAIGSGTEVRIRVPV